MCAPFDIWVRASFACSRMDQGPGVCCFFIWLVLDENDKDVCKDDQCKDGQAAPELPTKARNAVDFHAFASSSA